MKNYLLLRRRILKHLKSELPQDLYYHDLDHILDVLKICNRYIKREKIKDRNAKLLRLGALFHDIGFIITREEHEKEGVHIAKKWMHEFGFSEDDFKKVKGLIMATRIPQNPKNHYEKIICDADLDYLGRSDFYKISKKLFREINSYSSINRAEWNTLQIEFLRTHSFHTDFAIKNRQPNKEKRLKELSLL